jgi:hypothetical protein
MGRMNTRSNAEHNNQQTVRKINFFNTTTVLKKKFMTKELKHSYKIKSSYKNKIIIYEIIIS